MCAKINSIRKNYMANKNDIPYYRTRGMRSKINC